MAILGGLILAGVLETTSLSKPRPQSAPYSGFDYSHLTPEERAANRERKRARRLEREAAAAGIGIPPAEAAAGIAADIVPAPEESEPLGPVTP